MYFFAIAIKVIAGRCTASIINLNFIEMIGSLKEVVDIVTANTIFCTKEVLTSNEAARYMGISKSYLYKLTMKGEVPHYKPMGKIVYFNRVELEKWLQSNRIASDGELEQKAQRYCMNSRREA